MEWGWGLEGDSGGRGYVYTCNRVEAVVSQLCLTLCRHMDCSLPGYSVHGILQARILEWVAISFSGGSSWWRNWTQVSCIAGGFFINWATREAWSSSDIEVYLLISKHGLTSHCIINTVLLTVEICISNSAALWSENSVYRKLILDFVQSIFTTQM